MYGEQQGEYAFLYQGLKASQNLTVREGRSLSK